MEEIYKVVLKYQQTINLIFYHSDEEAYDLKSAVEKLIIDLREEFNCSIPHLSAYISNLFIQDQRRGTL
jgi:hypothetical protein